MTDDTITPDRLEQLRRDRPREYQRLLKLIQRDPPKHARIRPPGALSATEVVERVGVSYRQLDYWDHTEVVSPTLGEAKGSGSRRWYSPQDVAYLEVLRDLINYGWSVHALRHIDPDTREQLLDAVRAVMEDAA